MKSFDVIAETRRKWSAEERQQIVEETLSSPVSVVARKHRVGVSLLFRWRREAGLPGKQAGKKNAAAVRASSAPRLPAPSFNPVRIAAPVDDARSVSMGQGAIEIELANGHKLRVTGPIQFDSLKQVIAALNASGS